MSRRGRRGRPRRVVPAVSERPDVPARDEHVVGSTTASMNQPPVAGQAGPPRHQKVLKCQDYLRQSKWHRLYR